MALTSKLVKSVACLDFGEECTRGGLLLLLWVGLVLFLFSSVPFPSCERGLCGLQGGKGGGQRRDIPTMSLCSYAMLLTTRYVTS
jgi:hypothetical protein